MISTYFFLKFKEHAVHKPECMLNEVLLNPHILNDIEGNPYCNCGLTELFEEMDESSEVLHTFKQEHGAAQQLIKSLESQNAILVKRDAQKNELIKELQAKNNNDHTVPKLWYDEALAKIKDLQETITDIQLESDNENPMSNMNPDDLPF